MLQNILHIFKKLIYRAFGCGDGVGHTNVYDSYFNLIHFHIVSFDCCDALYSMVPPEVHAGDFILKNTYAFPCNVICFTSQYVFFPTLFIFIYNHCCVGPIHFREPLC